MAKAKKWWGRKIRWLNVTRLMARDGQHCQICYTPLDRRVRDGDDPNYITFDHIVPRSHGGRDDLGNLRLAHQHCNMLRGNDPILVSEEGSD